MKNLSEGLNTLKTLAGEKSVNGEKYCKLLGYKKSDCKVAKLFDKVLAYEGDFTDENAPLFVAEAKSDFSFSTKKQTIHQIAYALMVVKNYTP